MSKIRTVLSALLALSALTVIAPGHAETPTQEGQPVAQQSFFKQAGNTVSDTLDTVVGVITKPLITFSISNKDEDCLARNIFYEAANEPEEGKVAVGMVTINRVKDGRFAKSICDVVNQRTVFVRSRAVTSTEMVQKGWFGRPEAVTVHSVKVESVPICQFSWVCAYVRRPKLTDERWEDAQRIARDLINGEYPQWENKYQTAIYFHSTGVRPVWANQKPRLTRVGGHIFYSEKLAINTQ